MSTNSRWPAKAPSKQISNTPDAPGVTPRCHGRQSATRPLYLTILRAQDPSSLSRNADTGRDTPNVDPSRLYPLPTPPPDLPLAQMLTALLLRLEHMQHPSQLTNRAPKTQPTNPTKTTTTILTRHPTLPPAPAHLHGLSNPPPPP